MLPVPNLTALLLSSLHSAAYTVCFLLSLCTSHSHPPHPYSPLSCLFSLFSARSSLLSLSTCYSLRYSPLSTLQTPNSTRYSLLSLSSRLHATCSTMLSTLFSLFSHSTRDFPRSVLSSPPSPFTFAEHCCTCGGRSLRSLHRRRRLGPLRENGSQRHRIWGHAAHRGSRTLLPRGGRAESGGGVHPLLAGGNAVQGWGYGV